MKSKSGYTLLELIIGIAVFVTVVIAISYAFLRGLALNESARNLNQAMYALQQKTEEIKNFKTQASLEEMRLAYDNQTFQLTNFQTNRASIEILNVAGIPIGQLYRLSVQVSWQDKAGHIIGEDLNLDGVLNVGEDVNGNGRLDSPAQVFTFLAP